MLKTILSAFQLTEDDIKQNRKGKLSTSQRLMLLKRLVEFVVASAILGIIAVNISPRGRTPNVELLILISILLIVATLERVFRTVMTLLDFVRSDTKQLEDRIELQPISRKTAQMRVGKMKFRITAEQLLALRNGLHYTVYYAPHSQTLLSIEPSQITAEGDQNADDLSYELIPPKEKRTFRLGEDGELIADQDTEAAQKSKGY